MPRKASRKHPVGEACPPPGAQERSTAQRHASYDGGDDDDDEETIPRDLRPVPAERDVYSINAFCARNSISRDTFYQLQKGDLGPETFRIGNRQLITKEAAARVGARRENAPHADRTANASLRRRLTTQKPRTDPNNVREPNSS